MKRPSKLLSAVAALAAVGMLISSAAQPASAQEPRTRHGFWGAFGLGYGSNSLTCSGGCTFNSGSRGGGPTASIKLGGTPKPSVRLGGEVNVWVKDVGSGVTETVGDVSPAVCPYPSPRSGLFVEGGLGLAGFQLSQGDSVVPAAGV